MAAAATTTQKWPEEFGARHQVKKCIFSSQKLRPQACFGPQILLLGPAPCPVNPTCPLLVPMFGLVVPSLSPCSGS
eukprot:11155883-Lingulodinium_polyedra.AAC.1